MPKNATQSGPSSSDSNSYVVKAPTLISSDPESPEVLDLAIIGSGPAGLSAAIYAARQGIKTTIFERSRFGGSLPDIKKIENYPGFLGSGADLAKKMVEGTRNAGARVEYGTCSDISLVESESSKATTSRVAPGSETDESITTNQTLGKHGASSPKSKFFRLIIDEEPVLARSVLIATGSEPKKLPFELKIPVSSCVLCDAPLTKNKNVVVVGGGNSAVQGAIALAALAKKVTLISHSALKPEKTLEKTLRSLKNVEIRENLEPTPEILNQFDYCFVLIGRQPATTFLKNLDQELASQEGCQSTQAETSSAPQTSQGSAFRLLDNSGEILTQENSARTVISGLFSSGDVASSVHPHQVLFAAASGAHAALEIADFLSKNA